MSPADWLATREGDLAFYLDAVAYPETAEQIRELLALADSRDLQLIPYGGVLPWPGHQSASPRRPVLTVSLERANRLLDLDRESLVATFGPGAAGPQVESQLRALGYTLGHFRSSASSRCATGGSNNFSPAGPWRPSPGRLKSLPR